VEALFVKVKAIKMLVFASVLLPILAQASDSTMKPLFKIWEPGVRLPSAGGNQHNASPAGNGYVPQQIKNAYGISQVRGDGTGQTIALIDAYGNPTMAQDLNTFSSQFGLPQTNAFRFTIVNASGQPNMSDPSANGWMVETSLDVEWAHAIAPKANIVLVVARSDSNSDLNAAVDAAVAMNPRPNIISMSFGGPEPKSAAAAAAQDRHYSAQGIIFIASSGDNGAGVSYPASSPYVLSVGGTTLPLDVNGNLTGSETAWSGSGGGVSAVEPVPSYQVHAQNAQKRSVPDVSYDADSATGFAIYFTNPFKVKQGNKTGSISGWFRVGGTSAGSPQWAGLLALTNASAANTSVQEVLYSLASKAPGSYFRDITQGADGTAPQDQAHTGYDYVTGLGSPLAARLLPAVQSF
jgi:subtilase family serine protease